ncbi:MAG TPA: UbiA family prenyltransferase [Allosphingosinicella sp.]
MGAFAAWRFHNAAEREIRPKAGGLRQMGISTAKAIARLSRLPSCAVAFLTVIVPTYAHTSDAMASMAAAVPILTICMCTFILNDLNDMERDRVNHPERPLPSGAISPRDAAAAYAVIFTASLLSITFFIDQYLHYLYFMLLLLGVGYNVTVNHLARLKTIHVAITISLGLILVSRLIQLDLDMKVLATAFLFILGRELLMDVQDAGGDGDTFAKRLQPRNATLVAFALQGLGVLTLFFAVTAAWEAVAASIIALLLFAIIWEWRKKERRRHLLLLMQVQMLWGIVFLV